VLRECKSYGQDNLSKKGKSYKQEVAWKSSSSLASPAVNSSLRDIQLSQEHERKTGHRNFKNGPALSVFSARAALVLSSTPHGFSLMDYLRSTKKQVKKMLKSPETSPKNISTLPSIQKAWKSLCSPTATLLDIQRDQTNSVRHARSTARFESSKDGVASSWGITKIRKSPQLRDIQSVQLMEKGRRLQDSFSRNVRESVVPTKSRQKMGQSNATLRSSQKKKHGNVPRQYNSQKKQHGKPHKRPSSQKKQRHKVHKQQTAGSQTKQYSMVPPKQRSSQKNQTGRLSRKYTRKRQQKKAQSHTSSTTNHTSTTSHQYVPRCTIKWKPAKKALDHTALQKEKGANCEPGRKNK